MLINPSKCVSSAQNPERACYSGPSNQERGSKKGSVNRSNRRNAIARFLCIVRMPAALLAASFFLLSSILTAQTISTGSVIGNVTDPQGKPLTGAGIEIANKTNALSVHRKTTVDGLYSSGPIQPGDYTLSISATGFNPVSLPLTVFVGAVIRADVRMQVATEKIKAPEIATVNLDQGAVQGVLFGDWIEKLPSNGRNIFDLGQLEPDVQTQDAGVLDPSKNGIAAISIGSGFRWRSRRCRSWRDPERQHPAFARPAQAGRDRRYFAHWTAASRSNRRTARPAPPPGRDLRWQSQEPLSFRWQLAF